MKPRWLRKYAVLFTVDWSIMLAYRSESLIWLVGSIAQPLVSLAVWTSLSAGGSIAGYAASDYVVYFCGILLVDRLTRSWDVWELDGDIREGTFSAKLLRPFHPIHWSATSNLVYKTMYTLLLIPAWLLLSLAIPAMRIPVGWDAVAVTAVAVALASAIRFLIGYGFGLLAFWTTRATSLYAVYEMVHLFLAGRLAPLAMFPDWVGELARWLPFYAMVAFPVELLTGRMPVAESMPWLLQQAMWLVLIALLLRWQWHRGLRRYGAVGG